MYDAGEQLVTQADDVNLDYPGARNKPGNVRLGRRTPHAKRHKNRCDANR
jgi:hypothetical protein